MANKGIANFIRENGNILTGTPGLEIKRLKEEAEKRNLPVKYLFSAFYRLMQKAGLGRPKKEAQRESPETIAVKHPEEKVATREEIRATAKERLEESLRSVTTIIEIVLSGYAELKDEINELRAKNTQLETEVLEATEAEANTAAKIEQLVEGLKQAPALEEAVPASMKRIRQNGNILDILPKRCRDGIKMVYNKEFIKELLDLDDNLLALGIKSLKTLSSEGPSYPGLEAKKMDVRIRKLNLPAGVWEGRFSREIRFFWQTKSEESGSTLLLLRICPRKDTGFSEA